MTCMFVLAGCLGGDGSSPYIASNPSLANADSPSLATSSKSYRGRFRDAARELDFRVYFVSDQASQGNDGVLFTGDDNVELYHTTTPISDEDNFDSFSDPERQVLFVAPGEDGAWYTTDDVPRWYSVYTRDTTSEDGGQTARAVFYSDAGPDAVWFTDDDGVANYSLTEHKSNGVEPGYRYISTTYTGSGADSTWFTEDDVVQFRDARRQSEGTTSIAGSDGVFGTADDVVCHSFTSLDPGYELIVFSSGTSDGCPGFFGVGFGSTYQYPPAPFRATFIYTPTTSENIVYRDAGADGEWRTSDDVIDARFVNEQRPGLTGTSSPANRFTFYDDAGLDEQWLTADDRIARTSVNNDPQWMADASKDFQNSIVFNDAGADEAWSTMDDIVETAQRSVGGLFGGWDYTDITYRDTGPDRMLATADDIVSHYRATVCRSGGDGVALLENFDFIGSGPDNAWFTSDDEVATYNEMAAYRATYSKYDPNVTTLTEICSPLAESGWAPQLM